MPRPKGKRERTPSKSMQKSVKEIVRKELAHELEEKHAITEYSNVPLVPIIPSGPVINGGGNFFKLRMTELGKLSIFSYISCCNVMSNGEGCDAYSDSNSLIRSNAAQQLSLHTMGKRSHGLLSNCLPRFCCLKTAARAF